MLCINSKNDIENALLGLNHPEGTLRPEDFVIIKANWENKDKNISEIASELNILPESIVFIDDNPAAVSYTHLDLHLEFLLYSNRLKVFLRCQLYCKLQAPQACRLQNARPLFLPLPNLRMTPNV